METLIDIQHWLYRGIGEGLGNGHDPMSADNVRVELRPSPWGAGFRASGYGRDGSGDDHDYRRYRSCRGLRARSADEPARSQRGVATSRRYGVGGGRRCVGSSARCLDFARIDAHLVRIGRPLHSGRSGMMACARPGRRSAAIARTKCLLLTLSGRVSGVSLGPLMTQSGQLGGQRPYRICVARRCGMTEF